MTGSHDDAPQHAERRTRLVAALTALTMALEIAAGWWFNSMALLADGWHMGTHAVAIGLSAVAYGLARRYRTDPRFAFGPWKIEVLAAFASAVALIGVAVGMVGASVERLFQPQLIGYADAMIVAVLGLAVNLVCAWLLGPHTHGPGGHHHHDDAHAVPAAAQRALPAHDHGHARQNAHAHDHDHAHQNDHDHDHDHDHVHVHAHELDHHRVHQHGHVHDRHHVHDHDHDHDHRHGHDHDHPHPHPHPSAAPAVHDHHHGDLNLRSAYLHVLADAATSALAILALGGGMLFGWAWLDPAMGIVGAVMVGRWGVLLVRETARVLLDREMDSPLVTDLRHALDHDAPWAARARLQDLRVWRVGRESYACIVKLAGMQPAAVTPAEVRQFLTRWPTLDQVTVQIEPAQTQ